MLLAIYVMVATTTLPQPVISSQQGSHPRRSLDSPNTEKNKTSY
jgi:hypothetical protein